MYTTAKINILTKIQKTIIITTITIISMIPKRITDDTHLKI